MAQDLGPAFDLFMQRVFTMCKTLATYSLDANLVSLMSEFAYCLHTANVVVH